MKKQKEQGMIDNRLASIVAGEDSTRQFKVDVRNVNSLASEMVAFANSDEGTIFIGVADNGLMPGLLPSDYLDTEDFSGPLSKIFGNSLSFVMRNLHKVQGGRGVNTPGMPKIPETVFEELLVNALIHRDYFVRAPIRVFIFDNRIEIISPGHLPNNLTVERIRAGISNIRNPILASFVAKGLLPYHGLGSGIKRALEKWRDIDFTDDREGCLFTVTIHRKMPNGSFNLTDNLKSSGKTENQVFTLLSDNPEITIPEIAKILGLTTRAVEKQIAKLRGKGRLRRIGPAKGGRWQTIEKGDS